MKHRPFSRPFMIRLLHWEYWPFHVVYALLYPVFLYYCMKARSLFFYSASNPTIENGGFLMESKNSIYQLIPAAYTPLTLYYAAGTGAAEILGDIQLHQLGFPLIIKPDTGCRGRGVTKVNTVDELQRAVQGFAMPFIVQPFVHYEREMGLFYVRYPNRPKGSITGIVEKEFVKVKGDGTSTIKQLLQANKRYVLQVPALEKLLGHGMDDVMARDEERVLVPFGNHARGCLFLDASDCIDEALTDSIDHVCQQVDGFYYGRLDIRYESLELLKQGRNFSIIELNGAGSEPTHIYDPNHSIFFAWKEIIRHWEMLYRVSLLNKERGHAFMPFRAGREMFRANSLHEKQLNKL